MRARSQSYTRGKVRRAWALIGFWDGNEFILENYLSKKCTSVSPLLVRLLQETSLFTPVAELCQQLNLIPGGPALLQHLIDQDLFIREHSSLDRKERKLGKTWKWGHEARFFHFATQNIPFLDLQTEKEHLAQLALNTPPPPFENTPQGPTLKLPENVQSRNTDFWQVLYQRRTRRSYVPHSIPKQTFSKILQWTWGRTRTLTDPILGPYILKTSPSGGARHPIDVYPIVLRVKGVSPGIYQYMVGQHSLRVIQKGNFSKQAVQFLGEQPWVEQAAAVFIMVGNVSRIMWKYAHAHAYRVLLLDAGHLGQTFHLVCTKLGLGPFTCAALNEERIQKALRLDGIQHIPIYAAAVGIPTPNNPTRSGRERAKTS